MPTLINRDQRLFVIPTGHGYSCLGFDVERRKTTAIRAELGLSAPVAEIGTLEAWGEYTETVNFARVSSRRLTCELHPALMGREGMRVEATIYGERKRFNVGKSTGWIPCHLRIHNSRSLGGFAISPDDDLGNVVVIRRVR